MYYLGRREEANWYLASAEEIQQWIRTAHRMLSCSSATADDAWKIAWQARIWRSDDGKCELVFDWAYSLELVRMFWNPDDANHNPGVTQWRPEHGLSHDSLLVTHRGAVDPIFFTL